MNGWTRAFWLDVKASYWFLPTLMTLAATALAFVTILVDQSGGSGWLADMAWFEPVHPEGARAQLTVIASAMITISSTVFAITIAAVVYASGNYGPRLLTNFMNDRGNQVSLGVFIATFIYNLLLLRAVRSPETSIVPVDPTAAEPAAGFVPQLSMLVSGISVLVAVGVLVYFLHHIPAGIRINSVVGQIGRRLMSDIRKRFPREGDDGEPSPAEGRHRITAAEAGYIEIIDFAALDTRAKRNDIRIALQVRTGDFVHPGIEVAQLSGEEPGPDLVRDIRRCFALGDSRTPAQDIEFLIDELVEIGLRALSPGINDPFTAITSIHWLSAALAELAGRKLSQGPEQHTYDPDRVRPLPDDFIHYLRRSFGALRYAVAGNTVAASVFLDALHGAAACAASASRKAAITEEAQMLVRQAAEQLDGPALAEIRSRLTTLGLDRA